MNHFTNRQVLVLGVGLTGLGAMFSPLQGVAQPPETASTSASSAQSSETPQPLATPVAAADTGRATRAIGAISGEGTPGYVSKFTGTNAIGNSVLFENGGKIGLGTTTPAGLLSVKGTASNIYAIYGLNVGSAIIGSSSGSVGVYGTHTDATGDASGVSGDTASTSANATGVLGTVKSTAPGVSSAGVYGLNRGTSTNGFGVLGFHAGGGSGVLGSSPAGNGVLGDSTSGAGVRGRHLLNSGTAPGVSGETSSISDNATGVQGIINATNPGIGSAGIRGINNSTSGNGSGVYGTHAGTGDGILGSSASGVGVHGRHTSTVGTVPGVLGETDSSALGAFGLVGRVNPTSPGGDSAGVRGINNGTGSLGVGVKGTHAGGGWGVQGSAPTGRGVFGFSASGSGIYGATNSGYAGNFTGRVLVTGNLQVTGTLSKGAGSFKIDHPVRPSTEYLSHSFVESPDMMNVYNGNTTTNDKGEVWVKMPDYFTALNRDFRYQLTPIGQFAQAIVGRELSGNRFLIRTNKPHVKVSWQVTGIRNDAYARQHRIRVEESKLGNDRGKYLYPAGFGARSDKQIGSQSPRMAAR